MTTTPQALVPGATLPLLSGVDPEGAAVHSRQWMGAQGSIVYFMRTSTCPVCHGHLRHLASIAPQARERGVSIVVIVPGGISEAAHVASRHPALAGSIMASVDSHATVGLFVTMGLQHSGTVIVDNTSLIRDTTVATIPMASMDRAALEAHLDTVSLAGQ